MNCDCNQVAEELKSHRPLFPANGWRVIIGRRFKDGNAKVEELPVCGLVWNLDNNGDSTLLEPIVWFVGEACYLSNIESLEGYYIVYKRVVPPNSSFSDDMKDIQQFLEDEKSYDLEELNKHEQEERVTV